jgi:hypothetical protein
VNPSGEARAGEDLEVTRLVRRHETSRKQASSRRKAAFHVLQSSEGQGVGLARNPRPGEKESPSRGGAGQSLKGSGNRRRGLLEYYSY